MMNSIIKSYICLFASLTSLMMHQHQQEVLGFGGHHYRHYPFQLQRIRNSALLETNIQPPELPQEEIEAESVATLRSVTICNIPKDKEPELLCDFLMEIGACSAAITDSDRGTDREQPLFGEPGETSRDPWQDSLQWAAPIWNRCNVTAHFPSSIDLLGVVELIRDVFPDQYPLETYAVDQVPNRDWVVHVQQSWKPILIGPYVLRFPWHTADDIEEVVAKTESRGEEQKRVELLLQGGIAFGTGEHPTTQLCLEWLHEQVKSLLSSTTSTTTEPITIMDYGAGSGVLGMAGCALSPERVKAIGVDIDVDAIQIANANAANNAVNMQSYLPPLVETADDESKSLLLKTHNHARKQLEERGASSGGSQHNKLILPPELGEPVYDMAVANILAGPLVALSSTIASLVRPGGQLAMSGILPPQAAMVIEAYSEYFDDVSLKRELGGWVLVTGVRKQ